MSIIPLISFALHVSVNAWLLAVMLKRGIWRNLPWFSCYITSELLGALAGLVLWSLNPRLYVAMSWLMEAVQMALLVMAVRESFIRTFVGFTSLRWFPWLTWGVIAAVLAYSWWKAVFAPPVHNNRVVSLIVGGEFTFRWGIVAVGLLSVVLERLLTLPRHTREVAVLDGSTVASAGFLGWAVSRSLFGPRYALSTQYVPEIAYLLACSIWIKYMSRAYQELSFEDLGMTPEHVASELARYRSVAEKILKRRDT
jgi:hypothetical protein